MKRLIIATLSGLLFGLVCCGFACSSGNGVALWLGMAIITGRTLMGFGIGISRFPMKNWAIHGVVMGFIFSIPAAFGAMMGPENPEMAPTMIAISTVVMGIIYGFLIELITSVLFKAKM
ncbi:MAG: hypothetical protein CVT99_06710 [Bacteroidetes bacterium HGW-Bacteroidetes-16]|jgi:uncharacterized membrane protein YjjP (DUF1212 family)|nr:MAG: hypothetical protein CVT99_06710 [Bacteroidetes bacterium HGW-Bacteroidetes-16]